MVILIAVALAGPPSEPRLADGGYPLWCEGVAAATVAPIRLDPEHLTQLRVARDAAWFRTLTLAGAGLTGIGFAVAAGSAELQPFASGVYESDSTIDQRRGRVDWENDMIWLTAALGGAGAMVVLTVPWSGIDAHRRGFAYHRYLELGEPAEPPGSW